jgi:hypothetical protein
MKKYILTEETIRHNGKILYRIKRLEDSLLGGFVESERNLSQNDKCFIYNNAKVYDNKKVNKGELK